MNPLVAGERFRYFGPDLDGSLPIQIQRQMASWSRETGRSNERPYLAARGGHEVRQLSCWHPASNHGRKNRVRMHHFDLIAHAVFLLMPNRAEPRRRRLPATARHRTNTGMNH